ncbi:MAG: BON domain-containing protein [Arenicellales bacterium]
MGTKHSARAGARPAILMVLLAMLAPSLPVLSGCVAAMVGAATVTGVDIATDRRTVGSYIDDEAIELEIQKYRLSNRAVRDQTHLNPTSMNGVVLLTGEVENPRIKKQVVDYVRGLDGVRQVVDETQIAGKTAVMSRTTDAWLTTKVKTTLYAKTGFDANRIKVVTEHGTVYLMGLVTHAEADQAVDVVRYVDGVVRVVKVFEYVG